MRYTDAELRDALTDPPGYALDDATRASHAAVVARLNEAMAALDLSAIAKFNDAVAAARQWVYWAQSQAGSMDNDLGFGLDGLHHTLPSLDVSTTAEGLGYLTALPVNELAPLTPHEVTEATAILDERAARSRKEEADMRAWDNGRKL
jgi:hypothetical protein